jgi:hypothetical protein
MSMTAGDILEAMHKPPSYPWIYRVPRGTMFGYAALAIFFGFFAAQFITNPRIYSALMYGWSSGKEVAASALIWFFALAIFAAILCCIWATYYAAVGKMVLWKDSLEIYRPFSLITCKRDDLIGKRTYRAGRANQYMYLVLVPKEGRPFQVLMNGWFKLDSYFQAWVEQIPLITK